MNIGSQNECATTKNPSSERPDNSEFQVQVEGVNAKSERETMRWLRRMGIIGRSGKAPEVENQIRAGEEEGRARSFTTLLLRLALNDIDDADVDVLAACGLVAVDGEDVFGSRLERCFGRETHGD